MTALSWASIGLISSLCGILIAVYAVSTASAPFYAWFNGVCIGVHLWLFVLLLRGLLSELRLRELRRRRRVLALRGFANAIVWVDRSDPSNPRHHADWCAMLGAYRALDELESMRASMGASAL